MEKNLYGNSLSVNINCSCTPSMCKYIICIYNICIIYNEHITMYKYGKNELGGKQ